MVVQKTMKIDKGLLAGSTTMLILRLLEICDMYGYQMIEQMEKQSGNVFSLRAGTLYPLLHGLERQGMITSYDIEEGCIRPRKYYQITQSGKQMLDSKRAEWTAYVTAVGRVMGGTVHATT